MNETEVERLVVRLMGDASHFSATIDKAVKDAIASTKRLEANTRKTTDAEVAEWRRASREANRILRQREAEERRSDMFVRRLQNEHNNVAREQAREAIRLQREQARIAKDQLRESTRVLKDHMREARQQAKEASELQKMQDREAMTARRVQEREAAQQLREATRLQREQARETIRAQREQARETARLAAEAERAQRVARIPPRFLTPPPVSRNIPPVQESFARQEAASIFMQRRALAEVTQATERHNKAIAEGYNLVMSTRTPLENYNIQIARAGQLLQQGALTQRQHAEYVQRTTEAYRESVKTISDYSSELRNAGLVIAGIAGSASAAIGAMALSSIKSAGNFTQMRIAFETMLGSAAEAQRTIDDIIQFSIRTPFTLHQVEAAARTMITFGETGDQLMDTLTFLGNAAAATNTEFSLVALVFNQIRGVGHLLMQDFRQLAIRGILSMSDIAKYYGVTTQKAQQMMTAQQISFEDVRSILRGLSGESGRFSGLMDKLATEQMGLWSNLLDSIEQLKRGIGQKLEPAVKSILSFMLEFTNMLRNSSDTSLMMFASVTVLSTGFAGLLALAGTGIFVFGQLTITYKALTKAIQAYNLANAANSLQMMTAKASLVAFAIVLSATVSVAIYQANSDIQAFNKSMEETIRLSSKLAEREISGDKAFMQSLSGMDQKEKNKAIRDEIEVAKKRIEGLKLQMQLTEQQTKALTPNWKDHGIVGQFFANSKELELQAQLMKDYGISMEAAKAHLQILKQEQLANEGKMSEAEEDAIKALDKWKMQSQTFGMLSREAIIAEAAMNGVAAATLNLMLAEDRRLTAKEKQQELTKAMAEYRQEVLKGANVLGLTAVQLKVLEFAYMGANAEQQDMIRNLALFEEGQKLMEKYKPPIDVYRQQLAVLNELKNAGAITEEVFNKALADAEKALLDANLDKAITFHAEGLDAVRKGTKEYYDILNAVEKRRATAKVLDEANKIPNPPVAEEPKPGTPEFYAREAAKENQASNNRRNALLERIAKAVEANNNGPTINLSSLGLV